MFFEKYKIIKELGHGTYGTVYKVQSIAQPNKFFASKFYDTVEILKKKLKKLPKEKRTRETAIANNKKTLESIKKEYAILKKLPRTKHFVRYYEMYENVMYKDTSHVVTVMELIDGQDLSDFIRERPLGLSNEEAKNIIFQFIKILRSIHSKNIVHRDIKPANVMIRKDKTIVLIDFGLSCIIEDDAPLTRCKKSDKVGTPAYKSPELLDDKVRKSISEKDVRAFFKANDIWATGVSFYVLLTGEKPFTGIDVKSIEKKILKGNYKPLEGVDKKLKDIVEGMLVYDWKKRPTINKFYSMIGKKSVKVVKKDNDRELLQGDTELKIAKDALEVFKKYSMKSSKNNVNCVARGARKIAIENKRKTIMKKDVETSIEIVECK